VSDYPFNKRGSPSRGRGLHDFNAKFEPGIVERLIGERVARADDVRVLEIGCGEGRLLMELRKLFPGVELHGINRHPWPAMRGQQSLRRTGTYYKIFDRRVIQDIQLPDMHFCEATALPLESESLDLVVSQVAFHYIRRKDRALEEIGRVLRVGGIALLHIDSLPVMKPDFFLGKTPRFVIYRGRRIMELEDRLRERTGERWGIELNVERDQGNGRIVTLRLDRRLPGEMNLGLSLDRLSSFSLEDACTNRVSVELFGYRSVFLCD
jgi:SAM-dependent methyltransferase